MVPFGARAQHQVPPAGIGLHWGIVWAQGYRERLSAPLGHANLTLGNTCVRSRTSGALAAVRDGAVHRLLDTHTETARGCVRVKVRRQNSHGVKLERSAKLRADAQI